MCTEEQGWFLEEWIQDGEGRRTGMKEWMGRTSLGGPETDREGDVGGGVVISGPRGRRGWSLEPDSLWSEGVGVP